MVGAVYMGWWMRGAGTYVNRRESQKAQLAQIEIDKGKLELENLRQAAQQRHAPNLQQQSTGATTA